jgi:gas vesicle protein
MVQLFEEHGVPRCKVWLTLEPHPLQPGWRSLDSETLGFRAHDTTEATAMHALTTFCAFHPLEMATHPIGLFLAAKKDKPMWKDRVDHVKEVWELFPRATARLTARCMSALYRLQVLQREAMSQLMGLAQDAKVTITYWEDLVVDLSTELVEKDLQTKQMSTQIRELEQQVEERNHTIEVLENQLQNTQQQLEEANEHLDMHHLEMHQDMDADEDVDIKGEDPEPASSMDTANVARSGGPPSSESSIASYAH